MSRGCNKSNYTVERDSEVSAQVPLSTLGDRNNLTTALAHVLVYIGQTLVISLFFVNWNQKLVDLSTTV